MQTQVVFISWVKNQKKPSVKSKDYILSLILQDLLNIQCVFHSGATGGLNSSLAWV